ncbi:MAG: Rieske (2Fe-2S) protein [Micromonosporaceae bacterium]|nr:Rieske (2Fe-2S) protein [Micromonosporaceae bacterium]
MSTTQRAPGRQAPARTAGQPKPAGFVWQARLENASVLDKVGRLVNRGVLAVLPSSRLRDLLHGVWLRHPLHPAAVDVPIGAWMSAAVLDAMPGGGAPAASTVLVGAGTAAAVPAAITGLVEFTTLSPEQQRVGLVHAVSNSIATLLYAGSFVARLRGQYRVGRRLAYLGLAAASAGAYLGGHLGYAQAAGVDQAAPDLRLIPPGWHALGHLDDLPEGHLVTRSIGQAGVLLYREGGSVTAFVQRCAHQSGPLGQGEIVRVRGAACVKCPWHGSVFRLDNGAVVHGPAATDQPRLITRITGGRIEVRTGEAPG